MQYDFFIAARYRNKDAVLELARKIRECGKTVYCFVESDASATHVGSVDSEPEQAMHQFETLENWQNHPAVREVFDTDMNALRAAETLILLLPAGKSAHVEAGAAYGMGKRCILIGEQKTTESLYLIFSEFYSTIDDFARALPKNQNSIIKPK